MNNQKRVVALRLLGLALIAGVAADHAAAVPTPVYTDTFGDFITGDNQFIGTDGKHHWYVNTGADDYFTDVYERPTVQTYDLVQADSKVGGADVEGEFVQDAFYVAAGGSNPTYYGYVDIVQGLFGVDEDTGFAFFGIKLFSENQVGDDGTITDDKFGEGTFYNIRLSSEDPDGAQGLNLAAQNPKDLTDEFQAKEAFGYHDGDALNTAKSVGGPGGITTVDEDGGDGFEDVVIADGKAKDASDDPEILFVRKTTAGDGRPMVEFALDYVTYNQLFPGRPLDPLALQYLVFDATRGLKGNGNYLWNDKYSFNEAGTPYDEDNDPENIYELDTLKATFDVDPPDDDPPTGGGGNPVPEPVTALAGSLALAAAGLAASRRR